MLSWALYSPSVQRGSSTAETAVKSYSHEGTGSELVVNWECMKPTREMSDSLSQQCEHLPLNRPYIRGYETQI